MIGRVSLPAVAALAALTLVVGCSRDPEPVIVADEGTSEKVQALNRRVQELEAELRASVVSNREADELRKRVAEMERDLRAVTERVATGAPAGTTPEETLPSPGPESAMAPAYEPPTASSLGSGAPAFSEEQITSFRKLQEEVDRRKDAEVRTERVKRQLDRAGVVLDAQTQAAVVQRTLVHEDAVRKVARQGFGRTDAERTDVQKQLDGLRDQYEADLRSIVPSADADKVVETLGRGNPGIMRRAVDRNTRQR